MALIADGAIETIWSLEIDEKDPDAKFDRQLRVKLASGVSMFLKHSEPKTPRPNIQIGDLIPCESTTLFLQFFAWYQVKICSLHLN